MVEADEVERIGTGLYRLAETEPDANETIAIISSTVPTAIVCLLSALRVHEIGTQLPPEVWIALPQGAYAPVRLPARVRVVRFSGPMLTYGVVQRTILGVSVSITSPARTVVDCFRFRKRIGLDVAMEALSAAIRDRQATVDEIWRAAEVCRIRTVIGPYLDALAI